MKFMTRKNIVCNFILFQNHTPSIHMKLRKRIALCMCVCVHVHHKHVCLRCILMAMVNGKWYENSHGQICCAWPGSTMDLGFFFCFVSYVPSHVGLLDGMYASRAFDELSSIFVLYHFLFNKQCHYFWQSAPTPLQYPRYEKQYSPHRLPPCRI